MHALPCTFDHAIPYLHLLQGSLNTFQKQHPLRDRARKLHLGILVIRFEMPFNVWCDHCNVVRTAIASSAATLTATLRHR